MQEIEKRIESLKNNPIFHMSLGSRELFHSNFLGWLGERHLLILLNSLLPGEALITEQGCPLKADAILREESNIDLLVQFTKDNQKCLMAVELKVKDILRRPQLDRYDNSIQIMRKKPELSESVVYKIALTLTKPSGDFGDWQIVTFGDLSDRLQSGIEKLVGDEQVFLRNYCNFIQDLSYLAEVVSEVADNNFERLAPFKKGFFPDLMIQKRLQDELRLHSTFEKVLVTKLAHALAEEALQSKDLGHLTSLFSSSPKDYNGDDIFLTSSGGFERGNGFTSISLNKWFSDQTKSGKSLLSVGIMLQTNQYRLMISHPSFNFTRGNANNERRRNQMYDYVKDFESLDWLRCEDKLNLRGYAPEWIYTVHPFPKERQALGIQVTNDLVRALQYLEQRTNSNNS